MRVLFLCHRIPYPPNKGDKIRAFHQLRALAARHEVDLFTLADDPSDLAYRKDLTTFCRGVTVYPLNRAWNRVRTVPSLFRGRPLTLPYFYSSALRAAVDEALRERSYDRIFVYCSPMAQYVDSSHRIPIITDLVDVDSDKWIQYAALSPFPWSAVYQREGRRLREYERSVCAQSSRVVVCTERERVLATELADPDRIHVISNGVDTEYFSPRTSTPDPALPTVIFTGDMSYFPNQTAAIFFAREVLPIVHKSVPAARFLIVGRNPGKGVRNLQRHAGIEVTGFVPDVRVYLTQSHVAVAPLSIASGIQNKILESIASGLPVVATSRAVQGLASSVAELVAKADSPAQMAASVVALLRDPEQARKCGLEGRHRVAVTYNWEYWLGKLAELVESPTGTKNPGVPHGQASQMISRC